MCSELGAAHAQLPDRPYSLAAGDEVIFTAALDQPAAPRVRTVVSVDGRSEIAVQTRGAYEQEIHVDTAEFHDMRLAYAQHVYKATADRALVLTGGWQTDGEQAYVASPCAGAHRYLRLARDLGEEGLDTGAIERLANTHLRKPRQACQHRHPH